MRSRKTQKSHYSKRGLSKADIEKFSQRGLRIVDIDHETKHNFLIVSTRDDKNFQKHQSTKILKNDEMIATPVYYNIRHELPDKGWNQPRFELPRHYIQYCSKVANDLNMNRPTQLLNASEVEYNHCGMQNNHSLSSEDLRWFIAELTKPAANLTGLHLTQYLRNQAEPEPKPKPKPTQDKQLIKNKCNANSSSSSSSSPSPRNVLMSSNSSSSSSIVEFQNTNSNPNNSSSPSCRFTSRSCMNMNRNRNRKRKRSSRSVSIIDNNNANANANTNVHANDNAHCHLNTCTRFVINPIDARDYNGLIHRTHLTRELLARLIYFLEYSMFKRARYKHDAELYFPLGVCLYEYKQWDPSYHEFDVKRVYRHWIRRRQHIGGTLHEKPLIRKFQEAPDTNDDNANTAFRPRMTDERTVTTRRQTKRPKQNDLPGYTKLRMLHQQLIKIMSFFKRWRQIEIKKRLLVKNAIIHRQLNLNDSVFIERLHAKMADSNSNPNPNQSHLFTSKELHFIELNDDHYNTKAKANANAKAFSASASDSNYLLNDVEQLRDCVTLIADNLHTKNDSILTKFMQIENIQFNSIQNRLFDDIDDMDEDEDEDEDESNARLHLQNRSFRFGYSNLDQLELPVATNWDKIGQLSLQTMQDRATNLLSSKTAIQYYTAKRARVHKHQPNIVVPQIFNNGLNLKLNVFHPMTRTADLICYESQTQHMLQYISSLIKSDETNLQISKKASSTPQTIFDNFELSMSNVPKLIKNNSMRGCRTRGLFNSGLIEYHKKYCSNFNSNSNSNLIDPKTTRPPEMNKSHSMPIPMPIPPPPPPIKSMINLQSEQPKKRQRIVDSASANANGNHHYHQNTLEKEKAKAKAKTKTKAKEKEKNNYRTCSHVLPKNKMTKKKKTKDKKRKNTLAKKQTLNSFGFTPKLNTYHKITNSLTRNTGDKDNMRFPTPPTSKNNDVALTNSQPPMKKRKIKQKQKQKQKHQKQKQQKPKPKQKRKKKKNKDKDNDNDIADTNIFANMSMPMFLPPGVGNGNNTSSNNANSNLNTNLNNIQAASFPIPNLNFNLPKFNTTNSASTSQQRQRQQEQEQEQSLVTNMDSYVSQVNQDSTSISAHKTLPNHQPLLYTTTPTQAQAQTQLSNVSVTSTMIPSTVMSVPVPVPVLVGANNNAKTGLVNIVHRMLGRPRLDGVSSNDGTTQIRAINLTACQTPPNCRKLNQIQTTKKSWKNKQKRKQKHNLNANANANSKLKTKTVPVMAVPKFYVKTSVTKSPVPVPVPVTAVTTTIPHLNTIDMHNTSNSGNSNNSNSSSSSSSSSSNYSSDNTSIRDVAIPPPPTTIHLTSSMLQQKTPNRNSVSSASLKGLPTLQPMKKEEGKGKGKGNTNEINTNSISTSTTSVSNTNVAVTSVLPLPLIPSIPPPPSAQYNDHCLHATLISKPVIKQNTVSAEIDNQHVQPQEQHIYSNKNTEIVDLSNDQDQDQNH